MNLRNQQGIVSIVAVIFASILMSVITLAVVSQMSSELHQSSDTSDRISAQYAAESGAEDTLAYLKDQLANGGGVPANQTCASGGPFTTLNDGSDSAITCRELATSGTAVGALQQDGSVQYDLTGATALDGGSLELDWDDTNHPTGTFNTQSDIGGSHPWQGPPALEITVAYNNGSPQSQSIYLLPRCTSVASGGTNDCTDQSPLPVEESFNYIWSQNNSGATTEPATYPVDCFAASVVDDYDCKIYLPGGPSGSNFLPPVTGTSQYVVRIKALGTAGAYQMTMRNCGDPTVGTCTTIPLDLSNATVDVTAQVGSAFQRVTETPAVRSNPLGSTSYALLGTDSICKTLQLINEGSGVYTPQFYADCPAIDSTPSP